jgi:vitamin B12 transporter
MIFRGIWLLALTVFAVLLALPQTLVQAQDGTAVSGTSDLLGQVVVTAGRTAALIRELSSNVTVLSGEDVELAAADNLGQILKQQGFYQIDYGSSAYVMIRGMQSSSTTQDKARVLILVNGRRTGVNDVNQIPVDNVDRIEIIRGPSAVQYGTSALGGVINVITKRGRKDSLNFSLETGIGSFGLNKDVMTFNGGYQNFDFSGSFSFTERDSMTVSEKVGGLKFPYTSFEKTSVMLDLGYTFNDRHRVGFNYSYYVSESNWPSMGYRDYINLMASGVIQNLDDDKGFIRHEIKTIGLTYDGSTADGTFDWSLSFSKSLFRRPSHTVSINNPIFPEPFQTNFTNQDITSWNASAGYNSRYVDVDLGMDFVKHSVEGMYDGSSVTKNLGFYMSSKIKLLDDSLFFSFGGRYDHFTFDNRDPAFSDKPSRSKNFFSPSVGVSYLPFDWLKLRANYSQGMRMPSAYEISGAIAGPYTYHPNPDLQPEESKTYEIGIDVDYSFFTASLTYFHTDWKNKITTEPFPGYPEYRHINIKDSVLAGYEFAASADLGQAFDIGFEIRPYINYTYLTKRVNKDEDKRLQDDSSMLPDIPRWTLAYGVTVNYPGIDLKFNANASHMGDIVISWPFMAKGSEFVALDLSLEKGLWEIGSEGQYGKLKLRIEARNVLDSKNEVYFDYPGPGRNFYIGLKYVY